MTLPWYVRWPGAGANLADRVWYAWHCLPRGPDGKPPYAKLEKEHDLPEGTISAIITGRRRSVEMRTLMKLATALKVSPQWLALNEGTPPMPPITMEPEHQLALSFGRIRPWRQRIEQYLQRQGFADGRIARALEVLFLEVLFGEEDAQATAAAGMLSLDHGDGTGVQAGRGAGSP